MTIQGPAIFLAQFMGDEAPFNSFDSICAWASELGYLGVQVPSWDPRCFDLEKAAKSKAYCEEIQGVAANHGLEITELSTHLQGQLVAVHPAYASMFQAFAPKGVKTPKDMQRWGTQQVKWCLTASKHMGLKAMPTFPGALMWHTVYPWPQRPAGLVEEGFKELARRWRPLLDYAEDCGVDCAFEIHPGEDLHDGVTWERFREATGDHARAEILYDPSHFVLQQLDYLDFLDIYHEHVKVFHVKDAEFEPSGRCGVYGGYLPWGDRPGRFRSIGDGQIDWTAVFTKMAKYDFAGWAVLEWECAYKDNLVGAAEGADFIRASIIEVAKTAFDDFAASGVDQAANRRALGLDR